MIGPLRLSWLLVLAGVQALLMAQAARARAAFKWGRTGLPPGLRGGDKRGPDLTRYRLLESPGCRRIVFTDNGNSSLNKRAAESLAWKLMAWEENYMIRAVLLQGQPGSVFSTGWDKQNAVKAGVKVAVPTLRRYMQLAYLLATVQKPTISCYNGEILGSGMGLGLGMYRVSTDSSVFQVTAPSYGWALDSGLSFLLTRMRTASALPLARYLALTGAPLSGTDMIAAGLTTHHMDDNTMKGLHKRMADLVFEDRDTYVLEDAVCDHSRMYYRQDRTVIKDPNAPFLVEAAFNDEEREKDMKAAQSQSGIEDDFFEGGEQPGRTRRRAASGDDDDDEEDYDEIDAEIDEVVAALGDEDDDDDGESDSDDEAADQAGGKGAASQGRGKGRRGGSAKSTPKKQGRSEPDGVPEMMVAVMPEAGLAKDLALPLDLQEPEDALEWEQSDANKKPMRRMRRSTKWWHRNFTEHDEDAAWEAHADRIDASLSETVSDEAWGVIEDVVVKFGMDGAETCPEYITYPERTRLVDADQMLLTPYDCTLDPAKEFPEFAQLTEQVNKCFKGGSVEEVVENLKADRSPWAQDCLKRMATMSPTSLKLVFAQLDEGCQSLLEDALRMEYRVARRLLDSQEFQAAVAMGLGDSRGLKEGEAAPWGNKTLKDVTGDEVQSYFVPMADERHELDLPRRLVDGTRHDVGLKGRFANHTSTRGSI